jgi:hypothetical protein
MALSCTRKREVLGLMVGKHTKNMAVPAYLDA